ncbi:hypothetical protein DFH09DRAFT_1375894 [Mycena vulgaris]|nr:hypothetical protein DFH09DRAFT_1375894 [Mycena vulgaris]
MSTSLLLSLGLLLPPSFFTSNIMSILINGHSVSSVSYSHSTARTTLSINLASSLGPARNSVSLLTSCTARFRNFSASIVCDISPHTPLTLVLGRDWASLLRDGHLSSGVRVGDTFDVWRFLVDTAHPLATEPLSGPPLRWSPIYPHRIVPPFNFDTAPLRGDSSSGESPNIFCIPYSLLPLAPNLAFTLNL